MDTLKTLVGYKFDLINKILNGKTKDISYLEQVRENLILVDTLIKKAKFDEDLNCVFEMDQIDNFISKTK